MTLCVCVHDVLFLPGSSEICGWKEGSKGKCEIRAFVCVFEILLCINPLSCLCTQEEQAAKLKAERIRVALEKIKEAQVKKVRRSPTHLEKRPFWLLIIVALSHPPRAAVSLWTSFTARRWSAEKIGHCSVWLCVCRGGSVEKKKKKTESGFRRKRAQRDNADTKHLIYHVQDTNRGGASHHSKPSFTSEWTVSVNGGLFIRSE